MKIKTEIYVLYENGMVSMCTTSRRKLRHILCKKVKNGKLKFRNAVEQPIRKTKDLLNAVTFIEFNNGRFRTVENKVKYPDFYQEREIYVVYLDEIPICFTTDIVVCGNTIANKIAEGKASFLPEVEQDPIEQSKMFEIAFALESTSTLLSKLQNIKFDILENGKLYNVLS